MKSPTNCTRLEIEEKFNIFNYNLLVICKSNECE